MPATLIVSPDAPDLKDEVLRLVRHSMPIKACSTVEQALGAYSGERILFGRPDMVAQVLPKMPTVEWVQSTWAGVEPLVALGQRNYTLSVIKGIFGPQMSEYVMAYLLAHELRLVERQRQQDQRLWFSEHSGSVRGKRLGMMGTGSIGRHIAATAHAFGMPVLGLNRSGEQVEGFERVIPVSRINEFLASIDYLVAALPGTAETNRLLNAAALSRLPAHGYLVNIGRGNVIDTDALIDALNEGRLAGAALDVFDEEPVPADSPLWNTPNLSITAHVAAVSHPSLIAPVFVENFHRFTAGKSLNFVFDFDAGY